MGKGNIGRLAAWTARARPALWLLWMVWLAACRPAAAHEFWVMPAAFEAGPNAPVELDLYVGQQFEGDPVPFSAEYVATLRRFSARGAADLSSRLPRSSRGGIRLAFAEPGTQMLAIDTHPNRVELPAERFEEYLRNEGLERIIALRAAAGQAAAPGRERYRRHIRTLVSVGGASDGSGALRSGQRLEILALTDPFRSGAGASLEFRLLFDGRPLAGALVKAWHRRDGPPLVLPARTDADGLVRITLPLDGIWMLSVVHMLPAAGDPRVDWDSFWGNLTFRLGPAAK